MAHNSRAATQWIKSAGSDVSEILKRLCRCSCRLRWMAREDGWRVSTAPPRCDSHLGVRDRAAWWSWW